MRREERNVLTPEESGNARFRRNWDLAFGKLSDEVYAEVPNTPSATAESNNGQDGPVRLRLNQPQKPNPIDDSPSDPADQPKQSRDLMTLATVALAVTSVIGIVLTIYNSSLTREAIDSSNKSSAQILRQMRNQNRVGLIGAIAARNGAAAAASGAQGAIFSAQAAQSTANTAAKQMELTERPWMSVQLSPDGPLIFDNTGAHLTVVLASKNSGNSPAIRVRAEVEWFPHFLRNPDPTKKLMEACKRVESNAAISISPEEIAKGRNFLSETDFPGNREPQRWALNMSQSDIEAQWNI